MGLSEDEILEAPSILITACASAPAAWRYSPRFRRASSLLSSLAAERLACPLWSRTTKRWRAAQQQKSFCGVRSSQPNGVCNRLSYRPLAAQNGIDVHPFNITSPRKSSLTAILFNFDPQQPDNIFFVKYDARAAELGDGSCAFRFHRAAGMSLIASSNN